MLKKLSDERHLPPLRSREEMLEILQREEYGYMPKKPDAVSFSETDDIETKLFCAGDATLKRVDITVTLDGADFTFPIYAAVPTAEGKHPFFICINFRDNVPDKYIPTEEIINNGFAVISFCYNDVTKDNGDFGDGLAALLYKNGERGECDAGKIAMWAWAAQRAMDYADTNPALDTKRACVCGHSRLGKAALLCSATDERFAFAYSNDSGCSGAALSRGKQGESIANICKTFPYWFCENYKKYSSHEYEQPHDQHYLLASIAPRYVIVGSADKDLWADPLSEMLCCLAASEAYEKMGLDGFVCDGSLPTPPATYFDGNIGYHVRHGEHFFSRRDWNKLIEFINQKQKS